LILLAHAARRKRKCQINIGPVVTENTRFFSCNDIASARRRHNFTRSALILIAASAGKWDGYLIARRSGFNLRETGAIGSLLNSRGSVELIVLNVGLDLSIS
jgi:hypothetical protein